LYLSPSQLCLIKRICTSYARARTHTCPCAYASARTLVARESILGGGSSLQFRRGVSLWSRSARVRNVLGCASFLTVLRTHRISRSLFLIPQCIPASPDVVSAAAGPATHARPAESKHHTRMQHAAPCIACGSRGYSGRVLLSDVPSPPHEVPTQADGHFHRRHPTEAGRRATPAWPRAPKPSQWDDQLPRSWSPRLGAAPSPRCVRSRSDAEPGEILP